MKSARIRTCSRLALIIVNYFNGLDNPKPKWNLDGKSATNVVYADLGCGMFNINKVEFIRLTLSFLCQQSFWAGLFEHTVVCSRCRRSSSLCVISCCFGLSFVGTLRGGASESAVSACACISDTRVDQISGSVYPRTFGMYARLYLCAGPSDCGDKGDSCGGAQGRGGAHDQKK
jgi:hypothetical protein